MNMYTDCSEVIPFVPFLINHLLTANVLISICLDIVYCDIDIDIYIDIDTGKILILNPR